MSDDQANIDKPRPEQWRTSSLFQFVEDCWNNSIATVGNKNIVANRLTKIDQYFDELRQTLDLKRDIELVPALLLIRSFTAYRAAAMMATSLPTDAYPLLRSCLENAGYARLIFSDVSLAEIWLRRDEGEDRKDFVRKRFTQKSVRESIEASDKRLSEIYQHLYERCIDFGAHPNEKAVTTNVRRESLRTKLLQITLLPGEGPTLDLALKTTLQVGICSLRIFGFVFKEAFERNGLNRRAEEIAKTC